METVGVLVRIPKKEFEELQSNYVWWGRHGEYIKKGTVLPKENGFIAICKPNKPIPEDIKKSLKETLFIADEDCIYNFDMIEIIDTGQEAEDADGKDIN